MKQEKFGGDRHRPDGEWVQATPLLNVVGWTFRAANVEQFFAAVRKAEVDGKPYGVRVRTEPKNERDPFAIAVYGFAAVKRWLRSPIVEEWHIGYVPADQAEAIHRDLLSIAMPIEAELYTLYTQDDYREVRFFVLAPPGNSETARRRWRSGSPDRTKKRD